MTTALLLPRRSLRYRRLAGAVAASALALAVTTTPEPTVASEQTTVRAATEALQEVLMVGNNWDGTADIIRSSGDFAKIGRINIVPDKAERLKEIDSDLIRKVYFFGIRSGPGEGHDQLVDDLYTTPDGKSVVASRPSFADVVSIDLATDKVNWRFPVSGYRADHMAISPDGQQIAVSASTANTVHVLDINTGKQVGSFTTGDKPHENVYVDGGKYLWNFSIGNVDTSLDDPLLDFTKGDRHITIVDTATFKQVKTIDMRSRLDAFGRKDLSNAIRPVAFTSDWSKLYFQVSFFNGFLEYDVAADKIIRVKTLPKNPATNEDRTTWVNDSRHHGMAINPQGDKLCIAGTVDNYATIVTLSTLQEGPLVVASKPYWATVSGDGKSCIISESGANQVTAIAFATGQKVLSVPVGTHPQRVRLGHIPVGWTGATG